MEKLVVYNDARRLAAISLSYIAIAICILALGFTQGGGNIIWPILSVAIAGCFIAATVYSVRKLANRDPLFEYNEEGVTDYTKPKDIITLPWDRVLRVDLKAASNNDLMLEVMGYKTADEFDVVTPEMKAQLEANQSDRVFFLLRLSGLWIRRSRIKEAYEWIKDHVSKRYPDIVFSEFKDPLSEVGKKKEKRR